MSIVIRTKKDDLVRALAASRACPTKTVVPMLQHVLVDAHDGGISVHGSDTFIGATLKLAGEADARGIFTVDGRRLTATARALPPGDVILEFNGTNQLVACGGKTMVRLPATNGHDYPTTPRPSDQDQCAVVPAEHLLRTIATVRHARITDETRPHLAGVNIEYRSGHIFAAATDGHRLAVSAFATDTGFNALVPNRGVDELVSLLSARSGDVEVIVGHYILWFRCEDFELSVKTMEDTFPPYQQIIPKPTERRAVVARDSFAAMVRRLSGVARDEENCIRLDLRDGEIQGSVRDKEGVEASDSISADFTGSATIGLNRSYLLDAIASLESEELEICLGDDPRFDPFTLRPVHGPQHDVCVVMPMRIN